jgi:prevent-host-death family protein
VRLNIMRTYSDIEASRELSGILKAVSAGERVVILSDGRPIAEVVPPTHADTGRVDNQFGPLLARLKSQAALDLPRTARADLYA